MSWRTVVVSNHAKLDLQLGFMVVRGDCETRRIILDEIDILLVESTAVSLTAALLSELVERKVRVIFCDHRRNPQSELVPHHGCHDSTRRIHAQLAWVPSVASEVWGIIVREKIRNQANFLDRVDRQDIAAVLRQHAGAIEPGDPTNREGAAARRYFAALFGEWFSRDEACPVNGGLDYGYQIMLSVFARELACEGYLTQLGINHHGPFNHFNLACDLVEPFRPLVDEAVYRWFERPKADFDKDLKRRLVALLHEDRELSGSNQSVINCIVSYTRSVTEALSSGRTDSIRFPTL